MAHLEGLLNQGANLDEQFFLVQHGGGLLRDGIDDLELLGPLPFEGIKRAFCSAIDAWVENSVRRSI